MGAAYRRVEQASGRRLVLRRRRRGQRWAEGAAGELSGKDGERRRHPGGLLRVETCFRFRFRRRLEERTGDEGID